MWLWVGFIYPPSNSRNRMLCGVGMVGGMVVFDVYKVGCLFYWFGIGIDIGGQMQFLFCVWVVG